MRIFFFITKSEQGGAQTHVAQLSRWLVTHDHEVAVMSQPGGGTPSDLSTEALAKVEASAKEGWLESDTRRLGGRFIANDHLGNTINLLRLWRASRCFLEAVDTFKPDVVACHSTMAGLIGRLSLRGRIPTTFTAHGWGFTQGAPRLRRWVLPIFERLAGRYAKKIICVSRNDLELARTHRIATDEKLVLVYNGVETVDNAEIASRKATWDVKAQALYVPWSPRDFTSSVDTGLSPRNDTNEGPWPPRNDEVVNVFFVGRLAAPKNPGLLVEAFSRLPRELQDKAYVTIIGDGPDRARLESLINHLRLADHVGLTGALPREDVLERLSTQADIFALISHWEGFPYSILEAMAVGVPVIASRVGGIPEALEQGGGILINNDSPEQLVEALATLITNNDLRARMGNVARQTVESTFSVEQMCEKTFAQYQQALLQ